MPEPVVLCFSGGKDCLMALHDVQKRDDREVIALLTTVTDAYDRVSMHGVRRSLLQKQAKSLGIPLREVSIAPQSSNVDYEAAMGKVFDDFHRQGIREIVFGDIFLEDLKEYRDAHLARHGLTGHYPLWLRDSRELVEEFLSLGFRAITVCVDPTQLSPSFVGREIDRTFLADLPDGGDPCGENGEFHTFVFDGPDFAFPIGFSVGETVQRDSFFFCDLISDNKSLKPSLQPAERS